VLPTLHPNGREAGLVDVDSLGWVEYRRLPGQGRVAVAVLGVVEVCGFHESIGAAVQRRRKGLEALADLTRRAGVPLYVVRFSPTAGRFEARSWPELQVVARGGLEDLARWVAELPPPPPTVTVKLTRSELETLEVAAQRYRCTPEQLAELVLRSWLQRQATQTAHELGGCPGHPPVEP
jgi:hypothetical protein